MRCQRTKPAWNTALAKIRSQQHNRRCFASASPVIASSRNHRVVVVGAGTAGIAVSHQLLRSGEFGPEDVAIVDPAVWHHYQPGWTLVGGGLKNKQDLRRKLADLMDPKLKFYNSGVASVTPGDNFVTLRDGDKLTYEQLVVAPGLSINYGQIEGLHDALYDPESPVSTIYNYDTCDKAFRTVERLTKGNAIFTQPAGVIKCAGAPQKVMWLALDYWKRAGLYSPTSPSSSAITISFATGLPAMFAVPKYAAKLEELRKERGVDGLFQHDLVAINGNVATFARPNGEAAVTKQFDLLHVVPKMGAPTFIKDSGIGNDAGYVDVDDHSLRHRKYPNIWSAGDASSLPTSKTAAAVTSEAPVLVRNLLQVLQGKQPDAAYDGYTSCPLLTEYGKVLLAEFKYGGEPKETFDDWLGIDQVEPRRAFYHLKKDFFPWVYYASMVRGTWGGPKGWIN
ncbi:NAD(FAD)-dependent dehydrogenase domain protein [Metarhizium robertsii]|uniref:Sulfide quinone-reductase n=2 Tax=Metarhizium robertsii TaxID=568076 RepID=E9F664_METRA|nr:sulfide quinone-reductase [Metarhizium robertsii ARSEF 23]EFY96702.1 sulfide quinone-reductase [Metarhizium robertsii ARSEF 23]EXU95814.1 NAD(FAD)-dependent dehydrogenase domain protein [Metarhizium robertsii]